MTSLLMHPALSDCRRVFLRNFEVMSSIGVHDFEKRDQQRVLFNVELYVPLADSTPMDDELHEVVDYDFIRDTIVQRLSQGHTQLQETLCDDIARTLLAHPKVRAVQLSTQKPDVYPDCDSVGVEVLYFRERT
ncbi:MAG: dihydroneopterin aldolase [Burkholderiaceae bacterium]|jgi:dihydroneopterin aldolase|nr:dihydroneopterin aldolase [Burkholderiaceae bacterium]